MSDFVISGDGSKTAFNVEFNEHYSSLSDGARSEKFLKHVKAAFMCLKSKNLKEINILDICLGLGYTSILSARFYEKLNINANIVSLEMDKRLLQKVKIIHNLDSLKINQLEQGSEVFLNKHARLKILWGDAKENLKSLENNFFNIIYQDPFSPLKNPNLWDKNHFLELQRVAADTCVITTYATRKSIIDNAKMIGFFTYKYQAINKMETFFRASSIFSNFKLDSSANLIEV